MKVLVATSESQRAVKDDYCFTVEGELVYIQATNCANPLCGCDSGFAGMASRRATTTAKIVERPELTTHSLRQALRDSLEAGGWLDAMESAGFADRGIDDLLGLLRRVTASAPAGTLVRRTGDLVWLKHPSTIDTPEV